MSYRTSFLLFLLLNLVLYGFLIFCNHAIRFDYTNYTKDAYHFITDSRANGGSFELLNGLAQYDAQFYIAIASNGYPSHPQFLGLEKGAAYGSAAYAFFPLYPLLLFFINIVFHSIEFSAFLFANIILVLLFLSLYFVIANLYSKQIAVKTIFLLFLFPFSIFLRSYFTEGPFLLGLVWFSYFAIKKKWALSAVTSGLLTVIHIRGLIVWATLCILTTRELIQKKITLQMWLTTNAIGILPFLLWLVFCRLQTGQALIPFTVRQNWSSFSFGLVFFHNVWLLLHFFSLPLHSFHDSQIDIIMIVIIGMLLFLSRKKLKFELWLFSFLLWIIPLFGQDTMSYSRAQIVSFPLFLFVAQKLKGVPYLVTMYALGIFFALTSLLFVNWYWLG